MLTVLKHGKKPFDVVVLHGGPTGWGDVEPIATKLKEKRGILEPLLLKSTIEGQISEVKQAIQKNCVKPPIVIGYSWGAWIAYIFAAQYPKLVKKIVLVSAGPFSQQYYSFLKKERKSRMSEGERNESQHIFQKVFSMKQGDKNALIDRLGKLYEKIDAFEIEEKYKQNSNKDRSIVEEIKKKVDRIAHFTGALEEAIEMRKTGNLLSIGKKIQCPVFAIHGLADPHPIAGVKEPLSKTIKNFRIYTLTKCGHTPWLEKHARNEFFHVLCQEIKQTKYFLCNLKQRPEMKETLLSFFLDSVKASTKIRKILGFEFNGAQIERQVFQDPDYEPELLVLAVNKQPYSIEIKSHREELGDSDQEILGVAMGVKRTWKKSQKNGWIKFVYVSKGHRKIGIGSSLIQNLEAKFKDKSTSLLTFGSSSPLYLTPGVPTNWKGALRYFQSLDWESPSERTNLAVNCDHLEKENLEQKLADLSNHKDLQNKYKIEFLSAKNLSETNKFVSSNFSKSWFVEMKPVIPKQNITSSSSKFGIIVKSWENKEIVGFIAIGGTNPNWLGPMGVKETHRRKGLGTLLVLRAFMHAKSKNMDTIIIPWVNEDNIAFYKNAIGATIHARFNKTIKNLDIRKK